MGRQEDFPNDKKGFEQSIVAGIPSPLSRLWDGAGFELEVGLW